MEDAASEEPADIQLPVRQASGIHVACARVSNFRALVFVEVTFTSTTVILGANNAGKSSFLDALCAAIGAQRRPFGRDDIHLEADEGDVPRDRAAIVDLLLRPTNSEGDIIDTFPAGSYWTELFGTGISQDDEFRDFVGIRATIAWNVAVGEYRVERKFLKEWLPADKFREAEEKERVTATQLEPIALHYIDAKRDMEDDLRAKTSFWRRMTDDLGLDVAAVDEAEALLSDLNNRLVGGSEVLKHVGQHLSDIRGVLADREAKIDISPVARHLRDLSKGLDVSISGSGNLSFPLSRHGMGTRSLASLLVFQAFASWRSEQGRKDHNSVHTFLALEEPEAHLHPQAQRSLYRRIEDTPAQVVVSTHSPYFTSQCDLAQLRLFRREGIQSRACQLDLSKAEPDDLRKVRQRILATRGDLLFANAILLFEGETEESSLPIFAEKAWGNSVHEMGVSFVPVNGNDYYPFLWLAEGLRIPWFIVSDAEAQVLDKIDKCLLKMKLPKREDSANIFTMSSGNDFEAELLSEGYDIEIEATFNELFSSEDYISVHIDLQHGQPMKGGKGAKDFKSEGGRHRAILDAMRANKTRVSAPLARRIVACEEARSLPKCVAPAFEAISERLSQK